jgi:hypothetical protein
VFLASYKNEENKFRSENREGKANKKVLTGRLERLLHKFSLSTALTLTKFFNA